VALWLSPSSQESSLQVSSWQEFSLQLVHQLRAALVGQPAALAWLVLLQFLRFLSSQQILKRVSFYL
jgi:hypothetical protein